VVAEIAANDADETTLLRAAHNLRSDAPLPEEVVAVSVSDDCGEGDGATSRQ
jgi:hypothetical protein